MAQQSPTKVGQMSNVKLRLRDSSKESEITAPLLIAKHTIDNSIIGYNVIGEILKRTSKHNVPDPTESVIWSLKASLPSVKQEDILALV